MILLTLLVFVSLIQLGEFLSEYSKRGRDRNSLEVSCKKIRQSLHNSAFSEASKALLNIKQNYLVTTFAKESAQYLEEQNFPAIGKLSEEYEIKMAKRLEHTKIISTVSPMLGLMGTLIPLGPALIGLSQGDLETLAQNLMIAFATTVVGLFSAGIAYVLSQVRRRWYWEDMSDIDYILDIIEEKSGN
ncbi:putative transporter PduT for various metalloporphyrins [Methanosarcina siciliae HI350]|uniref:Putative transporter PduT for various metalloporphyrins n=2 Tax=Methanosarcina siciliae TaxID=38027 RepID=A0A0E3PAB4_9EURY|nr:putative transporter PduT for various metalloporphyrins [Methanosarcina siciliae HI350]